MTSLASVAVTGLGVVSAAGRDPASSLETLRAGRSGVGPVTLFDAAPYPSRIAGQVAGWKERPGLSRGTSLLLHALDAAASRAGLTAPLCADAVLGTTLGGMERGTAYLRALQAGDEPPAGLLDDFLPACQLKAVRDRLGLRGHLDVVSNACASGTDAVGQGFERIRRGLATRVLAGGYDPLCEFVFAGFNSLLITAPTTCRPFDRDREGMVLGEGAAVLVLEEEGAARARGAPVLGYVRGYGAAADAHHLTQPSPEGRGLADAMEAALAGAGLSPGEIDYVNLHGTGTAHNDPAEAAACASVFGPALARVPMSSTKAVTGHTLGAAGAVEAVFCLLSLGHGVLPANLNLSAADPAAEAMNLVREAGRAYEGRYALSNSQGFGGECGALVLEKGEGHGA